MISYYSCCYIYFLLIFTLQTKIYLATRILFAIVNYMYYFTTNHKLLCVLERDTVRKSMYNLCVCMGVRVSVCTCVRKKIKCIYTHYECVYMCVGKKVNSCNKHYVTVCVS